MEQIVIAATGVMYYVDEVKFYKIILPNYPFGAFCLNINKNS